MISIGTPKVRAIGRGAIDPGKIEEGKYLNYILKKSEMEPAETEENTKDQ